MLAITHVGGLLQKLSESHHSMMHFEFSYVFSPKVTTFSPKPEFEMVFRTSTFLVKDALGIPGIWWTKNDIILVGFRVDNYWLLSTLSTEWWERNRSELKPVPLVSSFYATRRLNFFSVPNFFYQKTPDQRYCFLTKQVLYKQCFFFFFRETCILVPEYFCPFSALASAL